MKGFMYILQCADGSYYTGSTKNLEARLYQHKNGDGAKHTKTRLPVKLIYFEEFERISDAFHREKQIQGWSRKKKEALIAGDFDKLSHLSQSKSTMVAEPVEAMVAEPVEAMVAEPVEAMVAEPVEAMVAEPVEAKKQINSVGEDE